MAPPRIATIAKTLLANPVERGFDLGQGVLCVIDGAMALRKAIDEALGPVPVQRCIGHKRNVLDHLPERDRPAVKQRLRRAWARDDHQRALDELRILASELGHAHPGGGASLREGMTETLTVTRLAVKGSLKQTLQSTNPCESMIEIVRRTSRNVKRSQSGDMCLRWTAAGMLEAERQFRRVIVYRDLAKLALAVERDLNDSEADLQSARCRRCGRSLSPERHTLRVVLIHDATTRCDRRWPMVVVIAMAWCFAATLMIAGGAKLIAPAALAALLDRLPRPRVAARLLGLIEVCSGAASFVGLTGAYLAIGCVYVALACGGEYLLRTGTHGSCGCLGSAKSQLSVGHVLFNVIGGSVCLTAAVVALSSPASAPFEVAGGATLGLITAQIAVATWLCTRLFNEASATWNAWNNPWWGRDA